MTDTTNQPAASKKPTHFAYVSNKGKDGKTYSRCIGSAWLDAETKAVSIQLDAHPIDRSLKLRVATDKQE